MFFSFTAYLEKHKIQIKDTTQTLINEFIKTRSINEKTKGIYLWLLTDIFNDMIESREVVNNPAERILENKKKSHRGRTPKRIPVSLSENETSRLMEYAKSLPDHFTGLRTRCILFILLGCGLRVQELCDLKDADMHLDDAEPWLTVIGKNNKERAIPIPEAIIISLLELRDLRSRKGKTFISHMATGSPLTPSGVYVMVRRCLTLAGVIKTKMSPHVLRHTFITTQLRNGVPLAIVKLWAGHDRITTTADYEHVTSARAGDRTVI